MCKIGKYKVQAALVRGFFGAFVAGIVDGKGIEAGGHRDPRKVKEAMADHYDIVAAEFDDTLFYPLARLNYALDEVESELRKAVAAGAAMGDLVRMACRTGAAYDAMVAEYRRNYGALLGGRVPSVAEHLQQYVRGEDEDGVESDVAITLLVRTSMLSYAGGLRRSGGGGARLRQSTLFRLMLEALSTLLHDNAPSLDDMGGEASLGDIFMRVCVTEHNFDVMTETMDSTYGELAADNGVADERQTGA